MKKNKIIVLTLITIILLMIIGISIYTIKNTKQTSKNVETTTYKTDFYSVNIPNTWKATEVDKYQVNFDVNGTTIATIIAEPEFSFDKSTSSIISNWIGMHAYAKDDSIDTDLGTYTMKKVYVAFELSAAQQEQGATPDKDELHYFYTSNKGSLFVDLNISTDNVTEEEADMIANSLVLNE